MNLHETDTNHENENIMLEVSVLYVRFKAYDSGFRIISVQDKDDNIFSVKGVLGEITPGSDIKIYGTWGAPYKGEPQFQCVFFEEVRPSQTEEIISFLSAGAFPGIGPSIAKKIVKCFGDRTFDVLDNDPDRLVEVHGIGEKKKERIKNGWGKQKSIRIIGKHLFGLGIPFGLIERIYKQFGDDAVSVIKSNPYKLCEIKGVGFVTADKIALKNGFRKDSYYRVISGLKYIIEKECAFGHTYALFSAVMRKSIGLLGVEQELISNGVYELCKQKKTVYEDKALYPRKLYLAEKGTAAMLKQLSATEPVPCSPLSIDDIEEALGIVYDKKQASAIAYAVAESVLVITGGPGTGKSSILSGILMQFEASGLSVRLAAPTGRAAKRMTEVTGAEATTIHRLLYSLRSKKDSLVYINADAVIIDETSMVDILLMYGLLLHIQTGTHLILIGDADQLPSVGPGTVLRDIIFSGRFRTVKLEKLFRQDSHGALAVNAKKINAGQNELIINRAGCGFYFLKTDKGGEYIEDKVVDIVTRQIPEHYGFSASDIQVLSPVRKAELNASTTKLNQKIREAVNPLRKGMAEVHNLRENDKVMNTQNDYGRNVFNGDTGTVISIDTEDKVVTIDFDGNLVDYDFDEIDDNIVLCYAVTVHKAQGSEYPVVVMPVTMEHYSMLQRTILYTAVTRARKMFVLVGEPDAVNRSIQNTSVSERRGRLYERLLS